MLRKKASTYGTTEEQEFLLLQKDDSDGRGHGETNASTDVDSQLTISDAVEFLGIGLFQVKIALICAASHVGISMAMVFTSAITPELQCQWQLGKDEAALLSTLTFVGYFTMAPVWGALSDIYGRRPTIWAVTVWLAFYGFLSALSPTYAWQLVFRAMTGGGIGGAGLTYVLPSEYSPMRWRVCFLVGNSAVWSLGSLIEIGLASVIIPNISYDSDIRGWRILAIVTALFATLAVVLVKFLPESVRFLMASGREQEARELLDKACEMNKTPKMTEKLKPQLVVAAADVRDLFRHGLAITTVSSWYIWFATGLVYYGSLTLPVTIYTISSYDCASAELQSTKPASWKCSCGLAEDGVYSSMLITTTGELAAIFLNLLLLDWIGRKKTMALYFGIQGVASLLLIPCAMHKVGLTVLMFVIRGISHNLLNVVYIYGCEVYPTRVRGLGVGSCSAFCQIGAILVPFLVQVLLTDYRILALSIYSSVSLIGVVVSLLIPYETKDKLQD